MTSSFYYAFSGSSGSDYLALIPGSSIFTLDEIVVASPTTLIGKVIITVDKLTVAELPLIQGSVISATTSISNIRFDNFLVNINLGGNNHAIVGFFGRAVSGSVIVMPPYKYDTGLMSTFNYNGGAVLGANIAISAYDATIEVLSGDDLTTVATTILPFDSKMPPRIIKLEMPTVLKAGITSLSITRPRSPFIRFYGAVLHTQSITTSILPMLRASGTLDTSFWNRGRKNVRVLYITSKNKFLVIVQPTKKEEFPILSSTDNMIDLIISPQQVLLDGSGVIRLRIDNPDLTMLTLTDA